MIQKFWIWFDSQKFPSEKNCFRHEKAEMSPVTVKFDRLLWMSSFAIYFSLLFIACKFAKKGKAQKEIRQVVMWFYMENILYRQIRLLGSWRSTKYMVFLSEVTRIYRQERERNFRILGLNDYYKISNIFFNSFFIAFHVSNFQL